MFFNVKLNFITCILKKILTNLETLNIIKNIEQLLTIAIGQDDFEHHGFDSCLLAEIAYS